MTSRKPTKLQQEDLDLARVSVSEMDDHEVRLEFDSIVSRLRAEPALVIKLRDRHPKFYKKVKAEVLRSVADSDRKSWREYSARPSQLMPGTPRASEQATDWLVWLILGGRGSGKSRAASQATAEIAAKNANWRIALISKNLDAVRRDMIEGQSGLLRTLPQGTITKYNRSTCEIWLSNGTYLKGFSSAKMDQLRGPEHHFAWADEISSWEDAKKAPTEDSTWSNLLFGLRLGHSPRVIATTTPKPVRLLRVKDQADEHYPGIVDDKLTISTHLRTRDNLANLAPTFRKTVVAKFEGTRLGKQELEGLLLDDVDGALWDMDLIGKMRVPPTYPNAQGHGLLRVVVAVDPSVGDGSTDHCGIVVVGLAVDGNAYILEDASMRGRPSEWCAEVAACYQRWGAICVVAEINNGHTLVVENLQRAHPNLPVETVWAKDSKISRAEPVALLSDQDRVKLACEPLRKDVNGKVTYPGDTLLVDQMTTFDGSGPSPDRYDAMVYGVLYVLPVDVGERVLEMRGSGGNATR